MRTIRTGATVAAALALLLLVGCTSGSTATAKGSVITAAGGPTVGGAPTLPPFDIGNAPRWTADPSAVTQAERVQAAGDAVVVSGSTGTSYTANRIAVFDAATGAPRWSATTLNGLTGDQGATPYRNTFAAVDAAGGLVLVEYYSGECQTICPPGSEGRTPERGIAALSLTDGSVVWKYAAIPSVERDSADSDAVKGLDVHLVAATDSTVLAVVGPSDLLNGGQAVAASAVTSVAIDPTSGQLQWTRTGVVAEQVAADTVLGSGPTASTPDQLGGSGAAVALDLGTGSPRWSLADRYPSSAATVASATTAVIRTVDGSTAQLHLVRIADGSVVRDLPRTVVDAVSDGTTIAWADFLWSGSVFSLQDGESTPRRSARPTPGWGPPRTAYGGYILYVADGSATQVTDRAGHVLAKDLPGRPLYVGPGTVALTTSAGTVAVYSLTG